MIARPLRFITIVAIPATLTLFSCFGPGDKLVFMPPLHVEGKILDTTGRPSPNEELALGLSPKSQDEEVLGAIRKGAKPGTHGECWMAQVRTDTNGSFSYVFPKRNHLHPTAVVGFIALGSGGARDQILFVVSEAGKGKAFRIDVHGSRALLRRLPDVGNTENENHARAKRGKDQDVIEVTLVIEPTAEAARPGEL